MAFPPQQQAGMTAEEHDAHMQRMIDGLRQIEASNDLNEVKSIAQGLLSEEQSEEKAEGGMAPKSNKAEYLDNMKNVVMGKKAAM